MMDEKPTTSQSSPDESGHDPIDQVSPDELMNDFRGKSVGKIVVFTLLIHAIFIGTFSLGGLFNEELTEEQQVERAVDRGMKALKQIAGDYQFVNVSDLADRLAGGRPKPAQTDPESDQATDPDPDADGDAPTPPPTGDEEQPTSEYEQSLEVKKDGPLKPELDLDEEDDLFAPQTP